MSAARRRPPILARAFLAFCACVALLISGCATTPRKQFAGQSLQRFEFEQPQMGVPFRIVLYAPDSTQAEAAAIAAFRRISELNAIMSDYETDSELSILSRTSEQGSPAVKVSPDLWTVLAASQRLATQSHGAFDITVGPSVALWRKARRQGELPDPVRLQNAFNKVGFRSLILDEKDRTAQLLKHGMRLDLGAIAKGYAADEALEVLRQRGINRALVAASGDLAFGDPPPGQAGWRVELIGYGQSGSLPSVVVHLANRGVATSGDLFQHVDIGGVRYSHVLNPFTGVGMTNHALGTVIAENCMTADSLATACTIVEPSEALQLASRYDAAVRVISLQNHLPRVLSNPAFKKIIATAEKTGAAPAPADSSNNVLPSRP